MMLFSWRCAAAVHTSHLVQVMSLGLSVEFCLHVAVAFQSVPGTR